MLAGGAGVIHNCPRVLGPSTHACWMLLERWVRLLLASQDASSHAMTEGAVYKCVELFSSVHTENLSLRLIISRRSKGSSFTARFGQARLTAHTSLGMVPPAPPRPKAVLSIHPSFHPAIYPSIHPSICPSFHPSIHLYQSLLPGPQGRHGTPLTPRHTRPKGPRMRPPLASGTVARAPRPKLNPNKERRPNGGE